MAGDKKKGQATARTAGGRSRKGGYVGRSFPSASASRAKRRG